MIGQASAVPSDCRYDQFTPQFIRQGLLAKLYQEEVTSLFNQRQDGNSKVSLSQLIRDMGVVGEMELREDIRKQTNELMVSNNLGLRMIRIHEEKLDGGGQEIRFYSDYEKDPSVPFLVVVKFNLSSAYFYVHHEEVSLLMAQREVRSRLAVILEEAIENAKPKALVLKGPTDRFQFRLSHDTEMGPYAHLIKVSENLKKQMVISGVVRSNYQYSKVVELGYSEFGYQTQFNIVIDGRLPLLTGPLAPKCK
jgi:hypothetical protein